MSDLLSLLNSHPKALLRRKRKALDRSTTSVASLPDTMNAEPEESSIAEHLVVGINQVTRHLEDQIRDFRTGVTITGLGGASVQEGVKLLKVVFVCRADIDPPVLVNHLPHLVAAFNSIRGSPCTYLVPLPRGAEASLAESLGVRKAAVLAFQSGFPQLPLLLRQLETIPFLTASWLSIGQHTQLIPTHVKQLRTTAPRDMKQAKEQRAAGRTLAKSRNKRARSHHV
ncbi:hypothetical protein AX16_000328 [Volvariella volvacea WC 439]|nr:hypothetical protein AX16_000328 [Volvariella volvacea WC 439]